VALRKKKIEFDVNKNSILFKQLSELDLDEIISEGKKALKLKNDIVKSELEKSFTIFLGGKDSTHGSCLAVITEFPGYRSELGNQLAEKSRDKGLRAIGCIAYYEEGMENADTHYKVSLRSIGENEDTSVISNSFGGGGHRNASSFMCSKNIFTSWKL